MKATDIRPEKIFFDFLRLSESDCRNFFQPDEFVHVTCPACGAEKPKHHFEKFTFKYHLCSSCETLYVNPRPDISALSRYYNKAPSNQCWVDFYENTIEIRREKIFIPRTIRIHEIATQYLGEYSYIYDIGGGYGVISEELRKLNQNGIFTVIEPSSNPAGKCREIGLSVIQKFMEDVKPEELQRDQAGKALAMSFDILEHLFDPVLFLRSIRNILRQDDLFVFTALNNFGFDLSVLWELSDTISPPQHLTIFNLNSLRIVIERAGFELIELTTPGKLDVELVKKKSMKIKDPFIPRLVQAIDEKGEEVLQDLLNKYKLSSFAMGVAKAR